MSFYIYSSHLGRGCYVSDRRLSFNELYCEQCEDSDTFEGKADTPQEGYDIVYNRSYYYNENEQNAALEAQYVYDYIDSKLKNNSK